MKDKNINKKYRLNLSDIKIFFADRPANKMIWRIKMEGALSRLF